MQRQDVKPEAGVASQRSGFASAGPIAAGMRVVQARCRRILFVTQDPNFERGGLEFADIRCVPAKVTNFERALWEVEKAKGDGLVVVVDCADFERGLWMQRRATGLGAYVIALTNPGLTPEQKGRLREVEAGPIFFARSFDGGRDVGSDLDIVLQYLGPDAALQALARFRKGL